MDDELLIFSEWPTAQYLIAGWKPQWSDGGEISSGLPQYLIDKLGGRKIGQMGKKVSTDCYPFQVPGTHDAFRPGVAFRDGLPTREMYRENHFYDVGNGLIIFLGEEPWFAIETYAKAFFQAVQGLGASRTVAVEGYNGPAPPDLERSVNCSISSANLKEELEKFGVRFSGYGSDRRSGPTIGMALITLAHFEYPNIEMFRMGAMAPMYSFLSSGNEHMGINRDHRSFYDIMRRLKAMFKLELDLEELRTKGQEESDRLAQMLEKISSSNPTAKEAIERARSDYRFTPFTEPVELTPELDRALDDIIRNMPEEPEEPTTS